MAMVKCPECGSDISDQAPACPACGYPIAKERKAAIAKQAAEQAASKQPETPQAAAPKSPMAVQAFPRAPQDSATPNTKSKAKRKLIIGIAVGVLAAIAVIIAMVIIPAAKDKAAKAEYIGTWDLSAATISGEQVEQQEVEKMKNAGYEASFYVASDGRWAATCMGTTVSGVWGLKDGVGTFVFGKEVANGADAGVSLKDDQLVYKISDGYVFTFSKASNSDPAIDDIISSQ